MLAAFGMMLMWVLRVATKKQDDALAQLAAMTNQLARLVESQNSTAVEFRLRYDQLATNSTTTARVLAEVVQELHEMRLEDDKRTQAIREVLAATQRLAAS